MCIRDRVKAEPETKRTIILTGHLDVVDTSESRALSGLAFHPEEYTKRVAELDLPEEAARDLQSGRYLFGRGVMDMKCGLAIEMALLAEYSRNPKAVSYTHLDVYKRQDVEAVSRLVGCI